MFRVEVKTPTGWVTDDTLPPAASEAEAVMVAVVRYGDRVLAPLVGGQETVRVTKVTLH